MPRFTFCFSRLIVGAGAILLIGTSATLCAYVGYTLGAAKHQVLGILLALAALGGELCKPFAVVSLIDAARAREVARVFSFTLLAFACILYSVMAELTLAAGTRSDITAERQVSASRFDLAHEQRDRAQRQLAALEPARTVGELKAKVKGVLADPRANDCAIIDGPFTRKHCPTVAALRAEMARAQRRTELETLIGAAETTMQASPARRVADPLAMSLASYANALGFAITAKTIAPWLALIPVLFLEAGSAFALVLWRAPPGAQPTARETPASDSVAAVPAIPAPDAPETAKRPPAANFESVAVASPAELEPNRRTTPGQTRGRRRSRGRMAALGKLKAAASDGQLIGSQSEIARTLGLSVTTAHRELHQLAKDGAIKLATTRNRTRVCVM